jgi:hypothetical protein
VAVSGLCHIGARRCLAAEAFAIFQEFFFLFITYWAAIICVTEKGGAIVADESAMPKIGTGYAK